MMLAFDDVIGPGVHCSKGLRQNRGSAAHSRDYCNRKFESIVGKGSKLRPAN